MIAGTRLDLLEAMETLERDHPQFVEPLLLRDVYGLAYDEIAQQVGAPLGTIKAQIHHGRKLVRPMLQRYRMTRTRWAAALAATALLAGLTACSGDDSSTAAPSQDTASSDTAPSDSASEPADGVVDPDLEAAAGDPVEDSSTPTSATRASTRSTTTSTWPGTRSTRTLDGEATSTFRSTGDADHLQLDLGAPLEVSAVDGRRRGRASSSTQGKNLVVSGAVVEDDQYVLDGRLLRHAPADRRRRPPAATSAPPAGRSPPDGEPWTMQEPYGAFTWYPVNDQPSDKAFYDFTSRCRRRGSGIANGVMTDRERAGRPDGHEWHLDSRRRRTSSPSPSATTRRPWTRRPRAACPISYWVPRRARPVRAEPRVHAGGRAGLAGERLGPYPFDSLGFLLVDSHSGMETQTMITLGDTDYTTSQAALVHEMAHQWYGDEVTPDDWRDVWMNEGMAMYLQGVLAGRGRRHAARRG